MFCSSKRNRAGGFTLLELLLAISILTAIMTVTFMSFSVVTGAWKRGLVMADDLHHGDFVMDQLVSGLRSAYYPDSGAGAREYGFWLEDDGDEADALDEISWVKLGRSLVGSRCPFADSPHRVRLGIEEDEEGESAVAVRAWRVFGQPEDFDPEEDLESVVLSRRVAGFNCRVAEEFNEDDQIDWLDEWDDSNAVPRFVEVTRYLSPLEEGDEPIEIKRAFEIPLSAARGQPR